jgi:hypothetical protein
MSHPLEHSGVVGGETVLLIGRHDMSMRHTLARYGTREQIAQRRLAESEQGRKFVQKNWPLADTEAPKRNPALLEA